ncbi:response regulator [Mangrovibacterium diazotrophicum]|uniref:histidine kinase n=1 Tax=Mangrovibacterium diazotrophicum TaxID=1261403 RepID=A0A419W3A7_9BACT|nr:response regulator [Mangrovibacterium diazotrophicum]RKD89957.1 signal transduction histidine kinase [Mangrovibacterium diazotrophicum]
MADQKHSPTILIVSDTMENTDQLRSVLIGRGYLPVWMNSGQAAVLKATREKFDLIILDVEISDKNGIEISRKIQKEVQTPGVPLIFITPVEEEDRLLKMFKPGEFDYVQKPFKYEELIIRIELHMTLRKVQEELKKSRDVAEKAANAKSLFLANMSHEIRTPLNGIVGMVDIMRQTNLDKEQREYLDIIEISGETLLMIINDILDFSKIEAGQISFEKIAFNIRNEIENVRKLLAYKIQQSKLDFSITVSDSVPVLITGDPLRLKQILINLLNNAFKFTEKGFVKLNVSLEGITNNNYKLRFEIEDSGIGISNENQSKLFKSFTQADTSTTRRFGGTGLGLAICKRLTHMMKGEIGVESELGKGSLFWFTSVFEPVVSGKRPENPNAFVISGDGPLRILLAEDNEINAKVSMLCIRKLGHKVMLARNGIEALELFHDNEFDIVLMDVQMPGMDGVEATQEIRRIEKTSGVEKGIPIIAMTANKYSDDIRLFLKSGMNDHLGKPFKPTELDVVIKRNLNVREV